MIAVSGFRGLLTATLATTGLAASFAASSADAQQPLRERCRAVLDAPKPETKTARQAGWMQNLPAHCQS
jgi:hypothetical protein